MSRKVEQAVKRMTGTAVPDEVAIDPGEEFEVSEELRRELEEATEELNEAIGKVEEHLETLRLGVSASVPLEGDRVLHYKKISGGWQLCVENTYQPGQYKRLSSDARRLRVMAISALPALLEALRAAARGQIEEVRAAREQALAWIREHP